MVANTVGKGEIARYEQFLLFPQCFQKTCTGKNQGLFGKGLISVYPISAEKTVKVSSVAVSTFCHTIQTFNDPEERTLANIKGKVENAGNQHFSISPNVFYTYQLQYLTLSQMTNIRLLQSERVCR